MPFTERSRAAREAILAAARRRFTDEGYERTTIRMVAADAGLDPSMVMRYYTSKEGLFNAAANIDLHPPDLTGVPHGELGRVIARHFIGIWESAWGREILLILLRSAASSHPEAAERVRGVFTDQIVPMVRAATGYAVDAEVRAGLLSTHLLGTVLTRYIVALPPVVAMEPDALAATMAPVLQHILTGPLGEAS